MIEFLWIVGVTAALLLLGACFCHLVGQFGPTGKAVGEWLTRAPGLDVAVTYFTAGPMILGAIAGTIWIGSGVLAALAGLIAAVLGQVITVMAWTVGHEAMHPRLARRPDRIVFALNRRVGRVRNHAAVWSTTAVVPVLWVIRLAEYVVYAPLPRLVDFPRYNHAEWVNVSRHKFDGLVGHDLIWCLYCDWMTGVWALGSEMLRNVESFWCPIRFMDEKKCANCSIDFPDVDGSWVRSDGTMGEVSALLEKQYAGTGANAWHGHPARVTVEGAEIDLSDGGAAAAPPVSGPPASAPPTPTPGDP